MGNGYTAGRLDDIAELRAGMEGILRRLSELEKPMGGIVQRPVLPAAVQGWAQNYPVPVTDTIVVSTSLTVPTGYTQCLLFVNGEAEFANNNAFTITAQAYLDATSSSGTITGNAPGMDIPVTAGATNTMTTTLAYVISGISATAGQTITVDGHVLSGTALSTNAFNAYALTGMAMFLA